ncbi:MAG: glycosyltransferase [Proteobacteria bacterium]|nr:glycosyltransferase [Pseudomonadota bacterium]
MEENKSIEYSVIIPAYNEEELLPRTLSHLDAAMQSQKFTGEVIVVDNNSTDDTARIATQHGAKVVIEPYRQISRARNTGGRAAKGKFIIFLDADTMLSADLLKMALRKLQNGTHCGGGTLINFDTALPFLASRLVRMWNWLSKVKNLAAGSFVYCLNDGFQDIGGFSEKIYASEEIFFSRQLTAWGKKRGLQFEIITEYPVITSGRKFHWFSSLQISLLLFFLTFFPWALRNRRLCGFWYNRPDN